VAAAMGTIRELGAQVLCGWCGITTSAGSSCAGCGSPMHELVHCRYCAKLTQEEVCPSCQVVLIRLWTIAQDAPDARFLFADVP